MTASCLAVIVPQTAPCGLHSWNDPVAIRAEQRARNDIGSVRGANWVIRRQRIGAQTPCLVRPRSWTRGACCLPIERHRHDRVYIASELFDGLGSRDVPQASGVVATGGGGELAVRTERRAVDASAVLSM